MSKQPEYCGLLSDALQAMCNGMERPEEAEADKGCAAVDSMGHADAAARSGTTIGTACDLLRSAVQQWLADGGGPRKLCIMLEHSLPDYEQGDDLFQRGSKALTSRADRVAAAAMRHLAKEGLVEAHLAVLTRHESSTMAEGNPYDDCYHSKRARYCSDDDGEDSSEGEEEADAGHVLSRDLSLNGWATLKGRSVGLGDMQVNEGMEVLPHGFFDDLEEDDEVYEGDGGAYDTLERYWHRAALVVWAPQQRHAILCNNNINGAVAQLSADVQAGRPAAQRAALAAAIVDHAAQAVAQAGAQGRTWDLMHSAPSGLTASSLATVLGCLGQLAGDEQALGTANRCLAEVLPCQLVAIQHEPAIWRLGCQLGLAAVQPGLAALVQRTPEDRLPTAEVAKLLHGLASRAAQLEQQPEAETAAACLAALWQQAVSAVCERFESEQPVQLVQPGGGITLGLHSTCSSAALPTEAVAGLLDTAALLRQQALLPLVQRLLVRAMARIEPCVVQVVVQLRHAFGWEAVRPAVEQLVGSCTAGAATRLEHSVALLRQLAEAEVAGQAVSDGAAHGNKPGIVAQHAQQAAGGAAAGKENAGQQAQRAQQAQQGAAAAAAAGVKQQGQRGVQLQLAALLAKVVDVALAEPDYSPGEGPPRHPFLVAPKPREASFVVDVFAAVQALLPAVGLQACRPASVAGLPLTGLADRLALLSTKLPQLGRRYGTACLAAACEELHAPLGRQGAAACPALRELTARTAAQLSAQAEPLLHPWQDWRLGVTLTCACADCKPVQVFFMDPRAQRQVLALAEARRKHVQRSVQSAAGRQVTCETVRQGSPHKLVLTKTKTQWEEAQQQGRQLRRQAVQLQQLLAGAAA